jgi:hypothetical protein
MGRRKGSKNKSKIITPSLENQEILKDEQREQSITSPIIKRGRGRPKKKPMGEESVKAVIGGNPSAVNIPSPIYTNIKNLKREIRQLKKLKLQCRTGSKERIELHRKIKGMKLQLIELKKQKAIIQTEPIKEPDTNKYKKVNYTGFLRPQTIEKFKKEYGIEFINVGYIS